jgi:acetyl-CoA carboxylase biotin carboxylase subunit
LYKKSDVEECDDMVVIATFVDYMDKISRIQDNQKEFAPPAESRWKKIPYINHF